MLLVEDDPATSVALRLLLNRHGWDVLVATGIVEAQRLLTDGPDAMVLDLMLPDGDGIVLLQQVRHQNLTIRVAVTTGVSDPHRLSAVQQLNPELLMSKPIDFRKLVECLRTGQSDLPRN